ncbi:hypothetical protein NDU88_012046 [Pleurodeles waltl]|uniref:Uncharacterized protein n=1 Tax=Pleurodeles waltl TaxID=8319 RepID=A0AAV7S747_PLEWA|nr:hypothetical protein NDU88_012046 [Pleurodeles waltl]
MCRASMSLLFQDKSAIWVQKQGCISGCRIFHSAGWGGTKSPVLLASLRGGEDRHIALKNTQLHPGCGTHPGAPPGKDRAKTRPRRGASAPGRGGGV